MNFTSFIETPKKANTNNQITIIKFDDIEDAKAVIDALKEGHIVIANLASLRDMTKLKAYQFMLGGLYAEDGQIKTITDSIYLVAPVSCNVEDLTEQNKDLPSIPEDED